MTETIYQALTRIEAENSAAAICTIIRSQGSTPRRTNSKMLVFPDGSILGTVGGGELENRVIAAAKQAMVEGKSQVLEYRMSDPQRGDPGVCGGQLEVFVEPVQPKPTLVVIGAGHVGKAVTHLAYWLGFYVVIHDDRVELCNPECIPDAHEYLPVPVIDLAEHLTITPHTYLVLTTRGVNVDVQTLPALLDSPAAYIGVIGSRKRWAEACKQLLTAGIPAEKIARVRSPIGLELNAETPEEIAVSILAEIIMLRQGGDGRVMSEK
jgi:xanthine dehydrogenase accessory factor